MLVLVALLVACGGNPTSSGGGGGGSGADGSVSTDGGPIVASQGEWAWIPVDGSVCGAGARAGIGLNLAETRDDLFIYVQGGGACWNTGTCVPSLVQYGPLCDYNTNGFCLLNVQGGQLPTAVHVTEPDPYPADGGGAFPNELATLKASRLLDRTDPENPFRTASFVFVPYCTGDIHSGNTTKTYQYKYGAFDQPSNFKMHFAGATNMDAYLQRLRATFPDVKRVWLTGVSGGAFGATINFERVKAAFPGAEVHLLADSGPFMQPTAHWPQWRDTWNMQMPSSCDDSCDAGMPEIAEALISHNIDSRIALLSYDQDQVISWFFFAGAGANAYLNPPYGSFIAGLAQLQTQYDAHPNSKYFVVAGNSHVLLGEYGAKLQDGGYTQPKQSRDGGTDIKVFIDDWATGAKAWNSSR